MYNNAEARFPTEQKKNRVILSTCALLINEQKSKPRFEKIANSMEPFFPVSRFFSHIYPNVICKRKMMMKDRQRSCASYVCAFLTCA